MASRGEQADWPSVKQSRATQSKGICPKFVGKASRAVLPCKLAFGSAPECCYAHGGNRGDDRMRLVLQLIARLLVIVLLCLGAATIWATIDAYHSVDRATTSSAQRVSQALEALYWRELLLRSNRMREHLLPVPAWRTIETMKLISPGICIEFEPKGDFETPLCGQSKGIGKPAPLWFAAAVQSFLGSHAAVSQPISVRATTAGTVSAIADPDAAIWLAWEHILDIINVASLMAIAIAFLA